MNFARLERNIEQTVFEGMVKIGYLKGVDSRSYYDTGLLSFLLEKDLDKEGTMSALMEFKEYVKERLPDFEVEKAKDRFCFIVGPISMEYIYQHNQTDSFLKELVALMATRQASLLEVIQVFENTHQNYICQKVGNPEFSHIFTFEDRIYDEYHYCFYFDSMGSYYHRLLDFQLVEK